MPRSAAGWGLAWRLDHRSIGIMYVRQGRIEFDRGEQAGRCERRMIVGAPLTSNLVPVDSLAANMDCRLMRYTVRDALHSVVSRSFLIHSVPSSHCANTSLLHNLQAHPFKPLRRSSRPTTQVVCRKRGSKVLSKTLAEALLPYLLEGALTQAWMAITCRKEPCGRYPEAHLAPGVDRWGRSSAKPISQRAWLFMAAFQQGTPPLKMTRRPHLNHTPGKK